MVFQGRKSCRTAILLNSSLVFFLAPKWQGPMGHHQGTVVKLKKVLFIEKNGYKNLHR